MGGAGMGGAVCGTCTAPTNGKARCVGTQCEITCDSGYHKNGMVCDLNNTVACCGPTCKACGSPPNTSPSCDGTQCVYTCMPGFDACDGDKGDATGCEVNLTNDPVHCGSCPRACPAGANATATCTTSTCGIKCGPGFGNCNNNLTDGCEVDLKVSVVHCGHCNTNHPNATLADLQDQGTYDTNAGPPSCRLWLGEQCTPTGTANIAVCAQ